MMTTLRTYDAEVSRFAPLARYHLNEQTGSTARDSAAALDGVYVGSVGLDADGFIGDGAARFATGADFVLVATLSGTLRVSAFGDSITVSGQIPAEERLTPELERSLERLGLDATVVNRGVSGNTTADGLARVNQVIGDDADVVVLELGTNDALQQVDLAVVESNLREIITRLQDGGSEVLLTGTFGLFPQADLNPRGYADEATRDQFEQIFPDLAQELGVVLLRDSAGSDKIHGGFREGEVIDGGILDTDDPSLQRGFPGNPDGLHQNADGVDQIVERILPQTVALGAAAGAVNEPLLLAQGSFETWFIADDVAGEHIVVAKNALGAGTGGHFALGIRDGRAVFQLGDEDESFTAQSAGGVVAEGQPTHMVATFGAGGMRLYVNGELVASNPYDGGLDAGLGNFEALVIGGDNGSRPGLAPLDELSAPFEGVIDEVAIYGRPLLAQEVAALFQAGERGTVLVGTNEADRLIGGDLAEVFAGQGGADVIHAGSGRDVVRGQDGGDRVYGGAGRDVVHGDAGPDRLSGGEGNDRIFGSLGNDRVNGNTGADRMWGGSGDDRLGGNPGNDQIFGGRGRDALNGGDGNDLLDGGPGRDALSGGAGADRFRIASLDHGPDKILDFEVGAGNDVLDLVSVLQGFTAGISDVSDFLRLQEQVGGTRVDVNADGRGNEFSPIAELAGLTGLDLNQLVDDGNLLLARGEAGA